MNNPIEKDLELLKEYMANWFVNESGGAKGIVIGISGGKDSTVVAKLWADVIGKEKVFGVLMPNGIQSDLEDAKKVCEEIGIDYIISNIGYIYDELINATRYSIDEKDRHSVFTFSQHTLTNIAPRIRMTVLYAIAQEKGYRVTGTGNASEIFIGYCTKHGDCVSDINPIKEFLSDEVVEIGDLIGISYDLVHKAPADGLTGKTDEDNIGFTYKVLNDYLRTGICEDKETLNKIKKMNEYGKHKSQPIPYFVRP